MQITESDSRARGGMELAWDFSIRTKLMAKTMLDVFAESQKVQEGGEEGERNVEGKQRYGRERS